MIPILSTFLGLLAVIILWPQISCLIYIVQAKSKGLSYPTHRFSFPFGIPSTIKSIKAFRNGGINQLGFSILRQYPRGMTMRNQILGDFLITTANCDNAKAILSSQFNEFNISHRQGVHRELFGDGIFTLDGHGWQSSRAMLRPQFTKEQISHVTSIEQHLQQMVRIYKENEQTINSGSTDRHILGVNADEQKGQYIDALKMFSKLTLDISTEFMFGESVTLLTGGNPKVPTAVGFGEAFDRAQELIVSRSLSQKVSWFIRSREFEDTCQVCKDFAMLYVSIALERTSGKDSSTKPNSYIFLDELAKKTRDPIVLRDQAITMLIAGRDTTASLLSWLFLMLGRHKEVFYKLRESVIEDFGDGSDISTITFDSLRRSTYMKCVINETLRLYATLPSNSRVANKDTSLPRGGGKNGDKPIFVPKGTRCVYNAYTMHRNPDIWGPDADKFRPERWEDPDGDSHGWNFLPFNGGPRICLGQQYALTETSYIIVRLLQSFSDIELEKSMLTPAEPEEHTGLILTPAKGVFIKFVS